MDEHWTCTSSSAAHDSGVSTVGSSCSVQLQLLSPTQKDSFTEILMNEHNNNVSSQIDVVKLLELKPTDDEDQHSNSSSLESIDSLRNNQGSQEREMNGDEFKDEEDESGSTSCSEDSFEMSSACSIRQANNRITRDSRETTFDSLDDMNSDVVSNSTLNEFSYGQCVPSSSYSVDSFIAAAKKGSYPPVSPSFEKIRSRVATQINQLDTGLPSLDFDKLEKELTTAAQEREDLERRMLGEEVRRRLAMQVESNVGPTPQVYTRPQRSNLALRLQTAMNLQVCYINELSESETDNDYDEESEDDSDLEFMVRKSKSAPNLKNAIKSYNREAQRAKTLIEKINNDEDITDEDKTLLLKYQTMNVMVISKQKAEKALAEYRRGKSKASEVPRQARQYLSKTKLKDINKIRVMIENAISQKNVELVQLLLERDSLHMEHDSLRMDIDDLTQHESQAPSLDFKKLLSLQENLENGEILTPQFDHPRPMTNNNKHTNNNSKTSECSTSKSSIPTTPITPLTTPTSPTLSLSSVIPNSFSISSLFKR